MYAYIYVHTYVCFYGCMFFIYKYLLALRKALSQPRNPILHPLGILGADWMVDAARSSG
jgi:hypothetical protein